MSAPRVNKATKEIFIYVSLLFILLLTAININNYLNPKKTKVLGLTTENQEAVFWQTFLAKNPDYVPGWIETGNLNEAKKIDPNYLKP